MVSGVGLTESIQYAENPPPRNTKTIVNPRILTGGPKSEGACGTALRDVVLFWVDQGVAHLFASTIPTPNHSRSGSWVDLETSNRSIRNVLFPVRSLHRVRKVMKALAKLGFSQSYTYFTWRTTKGRIAGLSQRNHRLSGARIFSGRIFFVSTGRIYCRCICKTGEPWIFKARVALAAQTLSGNYGI